MNAKILTQHPLVCEKLLFLIFFRFCKKIFWWFSDFEKYFSEFWNFDLATLISNLLQRLPASLNLRRENKLLSFVWFESLLRLFPSFLSIYVYTHRQRGNKEPLRRKMTKWITNDVYPSTREKECLLEHTLTRRIS